MFVLKFTLISVVVLAGGHGLEGQPRAIPSGSKFKRPFGPSTAYCQ
jgi:hypothetical protein